MIPVTTEANRTWEEPRDPARPLPPPWQASVPAGSPTPAPPGPARPPAAGPTRRRRHTAAVAAAALLLGGAGGTASGWMAGHQAAERHGSSMAADEAAIPVGSTSAPPTALDVRSVVAVGWPSIVSIHTTGTYRQGRFAQQVEGAGTGIVLAADGLIVTNAHVVADADTISVSLAGESIRHPAELVAADAKADIAVVRVRGLSGLTPARFADSDSVAVGQEVVAIGNALDLGDNPSVTRGIVSALDRTVETNYGTTTGLIQTDAAISSGNSGGALLDGSGAVIGMNSAGAVSNGGMSVENVGFAIPSNTVLSALAAFGIQL